MSLRFLFSTRLLGACQTATQQQLPSISAYMKQLRADVRAAGGTYNPTVACYLDLSLPDTAYRFFVLNLHEGAGAALLVWGAGYAYQPAPYPKPGMPNAEPTSA